MRRRLTHLGLRKIVKHAFSACQTFRGAVRRDARTDRAVLLQSGGRRRVIGELLRVRRGVGGHRAGCRNRLAPL